jgi:NADH dehydrogenase [ubiquinone] 1 alpha subcomplex assembly factor 1
MANEYAPIKCLNISSMKIIFLLLLFTSTMKAQLIYDFNHQSNPREWRIVDDVVMGGRSDGQFAIDAEGNGVFSGLVSTENNGGFSSVRYQFDKVSTNANSKVMLRLKGDGKDYQFRIKDNTNSAYAYITTFQTTGEWQDVIIPLKDLYPSFRGRTLDLPNYAAASFEEITFLIGNKKDESFQLVLDKIELE